MNHEEWCKLFSTMEAKYNRKKYVDQIKRLGASKAVPESFDSNKYSKVTCNNKEITGFLPYHTKQGKKIPQ